MIIGLFYFGNFLNFLEFGCKNIEGRIGLKTSPELRTKREFALVSPGPLLKNNVDAMMYH